MPSLDPSVLDAALLAELRETLAAADYTVDRVVAAMGPIAHAALARNHTVPAERALTGRDDPLATLIRLWPLQRPVDRGPLEAALPGLVAPLIRAGILTESAADSIAGGGGPAPVRHRRRRLLGVLRPHPGPGQPRRADALRLRAGTVVGLQHVGPAHDPAAGGLGARSRHRLQRADPAPGHPRGDDHRDRREPSGAGARRADPHPQRRRGRAAGRLPLRTRTGSPLRPDHHQPAVRDVAAAHRRGAAGLPGDRVRRRRADGAPGPDTPATT